MPTNIVCVIIFFNNSVCSVSLLFVDFTLKPSPHLLLLISFLPVVFISVCNGLMKQDSSLSHTVFCFCTPSYEQGLHFKHFSYIVPNPRISLATA
uniref:Uncharacterized protein n=1 Tax=Sparus aurata TaxID=8175 RepID=A0A671VRG0_SPAAU